MACDYRELVAAFATEGGNMSKRKNRLLAEKEAILADMRCPHFYAGAAASGYPDESYGPLERRLAEIDAELYGKRQ